MLWNAAVVLTIIVAFGSALFALATDEVKEGEAALRANSSGVKYLSAECGRREL